MKKKDAISLFGSSAALGRALGLTRGRISQWDSELTEDQTNRVVGVAVRMGILKIDASDEKSKAIEIEFQPLADTSGSD